MWSLFNSRLADRGSLSWAEIACSVYSAPVGFNIDIISIDPNITTWNSVANLSGGLLLTPEGQSCLAQLENTSSSGVKSCDFITAKNHLISSDPACVSTYKKPTRQDPEQSRLTSMIEAEILESPSIVSWSDIAGLETTKAAIHEAIVWPLLRPDLFGSNSLRCPPRGVLFFGPPGTGKTMIARCIASSVDATFFSISASSLTSRWIGEGEKLVKTLFCVAKSRQPSVIFIDEIDSLLKSRTDSDTEASRRLKTEFLVQMDGAATSVTEQILVIGATNRPQELDEAARRRFKKRLYVPLPCVEGRVALFSRLLKKQENIIVPEDIQDIAQMTAGYSGSDVTCVCEEAAMMAIREIGPSLIDCKSADSLRPLTRQDLINAVKRVRPSVSAADIDAHVKWNLEFGSCAEK